MTWEQLTLDLDFGTIKETTTDKETPWEQE